MADGVIRLDLDDPQTPARGQDLPSISLCTPTLAARTRSAQRPRVSIVDLTTECEDDVIVVGEKRAPPEVVHLEHLIETPQNPTQKENAEKKEVYKEVHVEGLTCSICWECTKELACTPCGHVFCGKCISLALSVKKQCPHCRKNCTQRQVRRLFC